MTSGLALVATATGALTAALALGLVTRRAGLSPIVGYLLAGVVVGPFTPGFVAQAEVARELAELGIVLLMFGVGLQFHVEELRSARVAVPGALAGMVAGAAAGAGIGRALLGWGWGGAIVFGLAISVSSTVVLLRVLADRGALQTPAGPVAVGWLVVEDIAAVLFAVVVPIAVRRTDEGSVGVAIAVAALKLVALFVFTLLVGSRVVPRALAWVARSGARDLFTLSVLVLALGVGVGAAELFGASMALGAFLAGVVVGRSEFAARAASEALPMRDAFAVLFFVSIGMMLDPRALAPNALPVAGVVAAILVVKPIASFAVMRALRQPPRVALLVALALGQIGEFSFILAGLGRALGVLPERGVQVIVAAAVVTITLSPLVVRLARPLGARWPSAVEAPARDEAPESHGAIVVGYGPVGRAVVRMLHENGVAPTVVELNHDTVRALRDAGVRAVHGDATRREVLEAAGVAQARSLVYAASGTPPDEVARLAKDLNPDIEVLARATYVSEVARARAAGADAVVAAEVEVALAMTERLLSALGATREQLDRARDEARAGLSGAPSAEA